jgi:hypothetical protein
VLRASEEPHSSTALDLADEGLFLALERFDFLRCAILTASQAAVSMVVHLGINGIEARFWPVVNCRNSALISLSRRSLSTSFAVFALE